MKMRMCIIMVMGVFFKNSVNSQQHDNTVSVQPAQQDVFDLLKNYQVGNNYFSGHLSVNIPVYSYSLNGISIPINLSYSGGGVPPDDIPSIVGLGWSLDAGGCITRIVKNQPDEYWPTQLHTLLFQGFSTTSEIKAPNDPSYLTNLNVLNRSDWNTTTYLNTLNTNSPYTVASYGQSLKNANPLNDMEPDEFIFSINGVQGKFSMDHTGNWLVKCDIPGTSFKIEPIIKSDVSINSKTIIRGIVGFIMTGTDGTVYFFGDNSANNPRNIEYSFKGRNKPSTDVCCFYSDVMPSSWRLTKITTVSGREAKFDYKAMGYQSSKWKAYYLHLGEMYSYAMAKSLSKTWYLEKVSVNDGTEIEFKLSETTQLGTNETIESDQVYFSDINSASPSPLYGIKNSYPKLEEIKMISNGELVNRTVFSYVENANERLKLSELKRFEKSSDVSSGYKFQYNTTLLPGYGSGKTDHWGYYNGYNFFESVSAPYTYNQMLVDLPNSKSPNFTLAKAEILEKMTLPTGGVVEFAYQPHKYSKIATLFPFAVNDLAENKEAGGVRIWKIKKRAELTSTAVETEYIYEREGNSYSSGVLSSPINVYVTGSSSSWSARTSGINKYYGRGPNVCYSRVVEKNGTNGSVVYEYDNFDNGYNDEAALNEIPSTHDFYNDSYYYNKSSFRGKLRKRTHFNSLNEKVKENEYYYVHNTSTLRSLRNVHFLPAIRWPIGNQIFRCVAYLSDFSNDLLLSDKEKIYSNGNVLTTSSQYTYDQYNNIVETRKILGDKVAVVANKFVGNVAYDAVGTDEASLAIHSLRSMFIQNALVETYTLRASNTNPLSDQKVISSKALTYYNNTNRVKEVYVFEQDKPLFLNSYIQSATRTTSTFQIDPNCKLKEINKKYDIEGNVLEVQSQNNLVRSFLWGYNKKYLIAKISNSEYEEVLFLDADPNGNIIGNTDVNLFKASMVSDAPGSIYCVDMNDKGGHFDPSIVLVPQKRYLLRYWEKNCALAFLNPNTVILSEKVLSSNGSWKLREVCFKTEGGYPRLEFNSTGSSYIKHLLIYPETAVVSTYSYRPFVGISSETDDNGKTIYYEYDQFNRLRVVKDDEGVILKKLCYNYAGRVENCEGTVYRSSIQSGTFTRNNCGAGYIGGVITYTVPAGAYSSTISQSDADQQAQSAVSANGQSYANSNGNCISAPCYFSIASNWQGVAGEIVTSNSTDGTVTFSLTVKLRTGSINWSTPVKIATINGACVPGTGVYINFSAEGRNWMATITPYGEVLLQLKSGAPPYMGALVAIPLSMYPQSGYEY